MSPKSRQRPTAAATPAAPQPTAAAAPEFTLVPAEPVAIATVETAAVETAAGETATPDDDAFIGIGTLESAARIRRALSQLAAARAAFGADLGSAHQRRCLNVAAVHAAAAQRLSQSADTLRTGAE